jgi:hypothetical protein
LIVKRKKIENRDAAVRASRLRAAAGDRSPCTPGADRGVSPERDGQEARVNPTPQHSVELQLAASGRDLIAAIEAAQFARVIDRGEASGAAEAAAIEGFAELFEAAAESWERLAAAERAGLLARLGDQLERLEDRGWFVHSGRVALAVARAERDALQLPLAVVTIGRSDAPTRRVAIPAALALDRGSGAIH